MSSDGQKAGSTRHESLQKETYVAIIRRAILESCNGALTLKEIYDALEVKHPDIALYRPGWKNTTRHCLSMNPCFVNGPRPFLLPGKGGSWRVDADAPVSYSRNKSGRNTNNAQKCPLDTSYIISTRSSIKKRRQKLLSLGASISSLTRRGSSTITGHEEDNNPMLFNSPSLLGSSGRRDDGRDCGGNALGLVEDWEKSSYERGEDFQRQTSPWMLFQHQQHHFNPFESSGSLPPPNHSFSSISRHPTGPNSTMPSYSSTDLYSKHYVPDPVSSDTHHVSLPSGLLRQEGQWNQPPVPCDYEGSSLRIPFPHQDEQQYHYATARPYALFPPPQP